MNIILRNFTGGAARAIDHPAQLSERRQRQPREASDPEARNSAATGQAAFAGRAASARRTELLLSAATRARHSSTPNGNAGQGRPAVQERRQGLLATQEPREAAPLLLAARERLVSAPIANREVE